jgi:hypothetical protein
LEDEDDDDVSCEGHDSSSEEEDDDQSIEEDPTVGSFLHAGSSDEDNDRADGADLNDGSTSMTVPEMMAATAAVAMMMVTSARFL